MEKYSELDEDFILQTSRNMAVVKIDENKHLSKPTREVHIDKLSPVK